jgi:lysophospholipase L1-like esterase
VVLVLFPTIDIYNAAEPAKYDEAIRRLERYAADSPRVEFLNYNPEYASRHELFYDHIHLNPAGQREVTQRLARDLRKWAVDRW